MKKIFLFTLIGFCFLFIELFSLEEENWITQEWDNGVWVNAYRDVYHLENGLLMMLVFQTWDGSGWGDQTRFIHEYDSEGREISYMIQFHDSEGWYDYMKDQYFYEGGKLVKYVLWYGGENREPLEKDSEILRFYNDNDLLEKREIYRWDNGEKMLYEEEYTYYDDKLREIERVSKKFDFVSEDLKNNFREIKSYEANHLAPSVTINQKWENDDWLNLQKSSYVFDEKGLWIENILQNWADDWVNVTKRTMERNDKNQDLARTVMIWYEEQGWVNSSRTLSEYNDDDKLAIGLEQIYSTDNWVNHTEYSYYYEKDRRYLTLKRFWDEDQWVNQSKTYLDGWVGVDDMAFTNLRLNIFPNPASNNLTISFYNEDHSFIDARILSLDGNQGLAICNESVAPGEIVLNQDISNLPSGHYLLLMNMEGNKIIQKFIINR